MKKISSLISKILKKLHININEKTCLQIIKFIIVGGIATLIDWIIYYILYNYININPLLANIISFSISVIYNYIASVIWVFDVDKNKSKKVIFIEFIILSLLGLALTELLLYLLIKININEMISKIISTILVMIFNFITRKIFLEERKK